MDAVKFLQAYQRMCENTLCENCPVARSNGDCRIAISMSQLADLKELVSEVEQWAIDHPIKTRSMKLLEMFPNALIKDGGIPDIDPCSIDTVNYEMDGCMRDCAECRREYWKQEAE